MSALNVTPCFLLLLTFTQVIQLWDAKFQDLVVGLERVHYVILILMLKQHLLQLPIILFALYYRKQNCCHRQEI